MAREGELEAFVSRLFSYGFRPLFLCMIVAALVLIPWWVAVMKGAAPPPSGDVSLLAWHGHEMLFGFVGAAIGGFLLTAVSNWTGRPPVSGAPLAVLMACWLAARVVAFERFGLPPLAVMLIEAAYFALLTILMGREVWLGQNLRNMKIVGILAAFTLLNLLFHVGAVFETAWRPEEIAIRGAFLLVCILITVIAGRIIPAFTGNWLRRRYGSDTSVPPGFGNVDLLVVVATVLTAFAWALWPASTVTGCLALATGCLHVLRVARWKPHRALPDPLLIVLHVGYAWLGVGLALLGLGILLPHVPPSAGIHAIGVGAMATLILAVASRAALGHTNRPLIAGPLLSMAYLAVNAAAIVRVLVSLVGMDLLVVAGALWVLAFALFSIRFAPVLLGPPAR